jgi:glutathione synthase/RimK-type ligase-like ATP-grasp enzyme
MSTVLFIASVGQRYYYDAFAAACRKKGHRVYLLDPKRLPHRMTLSVAMDESGTISGFIDVLEHCGSDLKDARIPIQDVEVAWYLREDPQQDKPNASLESRFAESESHCAVTSLLSVLDCKWVNHKEVIRRVSSNKLYQQKIAHQCGLTIPKTLVGNDPRAVERMSGGAGGLLLKTLGSIQLDEEGCYFLYSERFSHEELLEGADAIRAAPVYAQEYIEKRYEYRVMVIGTRVLACRIDSQASPQTTVDWRHYDFEHVEHIRADLPGSVARDLVAFMNAIDLRYGAIDLIETRSDDFVFLEVNPSGQWGWIEHYSKLGIPEAVAEMIGEV